MSSKTCSQEWMVINRVGMDPPTPASLCSSGCLKLKIMCMCVRYFYHLCDEIPGWINVGEKRLIWAHISWSGTHGSWIALCSPSRLVASWITMEPSVTVRLGSSPPGPPPPIPFPQSFTISQSSTIIWGLSVQIHESVGDILHLILCFSVNLSSFSFESSTHLV